MEKCFCKNVVWKKAEKINVYNMFFVKNVLYSISKMGIGSSYSAISYHDDRGGVYVLEDMVGQRLYHWHTTGFKLDVMVNVGDSEVNAHLLHYRDKDTLFSNEHDGHIDITVLNSCIQIKDVYLTVNGICTLTLTKTMFAAIRTYVEKCGREVLFGQVIITSANAKVAFNIYNQAFVNNGFCTTTMRSKEDNVTNWTIFFHKTIKQPVLIMSLNTAVSKLNTRHS